MKVLHYITDLTGTKGPMAAMVRKMVFSTSKVVETHILTCHKLTSEQETALQTQYAVSVHYVKEAKGKNPMEHFAAMQGIRNVIKSVKPDVVHVHGSWDHVAAATEKIARMCGFVTIVSPHRGLSQEIINIDFWKQRLVRLLAYQIWMIRNCSIVIALNEKEQKELLNLSLKKRIEVLPQMTTDTESDNLLRDALLRYYRKALDSNYHRYITPEEQDFVYKLVRKAVVEEEKESEPLAMQNLSLRRVYFYAYDEDVIDLMMEGVRRYQINMPPVLDVANVPRYINRKAKKRGTITDVKSNKNITIPKSQDQEYLAVEMICSAKVITLKRLTLRHCAELYRLYRYTDFNEDVVSEELKRLKLTSFNKKLQKKLTSMFGLEYGYTI